MREVMNVAELMDFFNSLTQNGMRSAQWLHALDDGPITRSFEGQTFTVIRCGTNGFLVMFK